LSPATDRRLLRNALIGWGLCWRSGRIMSLAQIGCGLVSGLLPASIAWLTKLLIDTLVGGAPAARVQGLAAGLAAVGLAVATLPHLSAYLEGELGRRVDRLVQHRLYGAVSAFNGLARLENPRFLDDLRMAMQATGGGLRPVTTGIIAPATNLVTLLSLLATLYVISPVMAGVVVAAAAPALLAQISLSRRQVGIQARITPAVRRQLFYSTLIMDVQAAKETRLLGLGRFLGDRLLGELATVHAGERTIDTRTLRTQSLLALLSALVAGAGLVWAAYATAAGRLSLGDLSAFVAAVAGSQQALAALVATVSGAYQALLVFDYFVKLTELPDDLAPRTATAALPALRQGIELRDVWFRYDDSHPWVLRGVDLTIPCGQSVALVGLNGAGKSTLVKLLCRFYDPVRGAILWDGVDIRDVPAAHLRRRMGVLFQDFMSYDLTAAENIGIGDLAALSDRDRIVTAASAAGIDTAIGGLPRGYDTLLSRVFASEEDKQNPETGVEFSGGQWQRLALARTLMRDNRDLLILDELASGLDAEAEHEVHERLRRHRAGRTSLLISHRLGAVRDADRIVVLSDGQVHEQGSHEALLAEGGIYARLFTLQGSGYHA
jgi:ATP-binding cassette, subfamily B, bacterial